MDPSESRKLTYYYVNPSTFGPKIKEYLDTDVLPCKPDFIMLVETRLQGNASRRARRWCRRRGYNIKVSAAHAGIGKGRKGGCPYRLALPFGGGYPWRFGP